MNRVPSEPQRVLIINASSVAATGAVVGDAVVVFDAQEERADIGVGDLLAHIAAMAGALLALIHSLQQRLAIEVLALVAPEERREVEGGVTKKVFRKSRVRSGRINTSLMTARSCRTPGSSA